jgi:hypothetical protein
MYYQLSHAAAVMGNFSLNINSFGKFLWYLAVFIPVIMATKSNINLSQCLKRECTPCQPTVKWFLIQQTLLFKIYKTLLNESFVDKNGVSNSYTSKNLVTTILTHADIAQVSPKL